MNVCWAWFCSTSWANSCGAFKSSSVVLKVFHRSSHGLMRSFPEAFWSGNCFPYNIKILFVFFSEWWWYISSGGKKCKLQMPSVQFSSVQSLSCVRLFATPWIAACQASLSITNFRSLLKLMSIELVMSSSPLILCRPLLLLPPIPPSIKQESIHWHQTMLVCHCTCHHTNSFFLFVFFKSGFARGILDEAIYETWPLSTHPLKILTWKWEVCI